MTKSQFFEYTKDKFFFYNPYEIAEYVKKHCRRQAEDVIKAADDVAEKRFLFNLRWDMERTLEPVVFKEEIDWLYQPGDDPEWIFALNRMRFWICLGQAYVLTKDEKYAKAFVQQMCHWVRTVKRENPANAKAWRSIEAGLRLEYWLKAVCYFERSPYLTDEAMTLFCDSITEHAEFIMTVWDTFNLMSNWGVLANHGLFLAGIMLPKNARTKEYADEAVRRLALESKMQVYRDGAHWEQSPMYHNEVLHCFLDVLLLAKRNKYHLPGDFKQRVRAMCVFDMYAAKPDHHELSMGDSDEIDQRDIITKGALVFADPELKSRGYDIPDFDTIWDIGECGLLEYKFLSARTPAQTDMAFGDSGNFYCRSSWREEATFLHFHCGTLGAGHGHADKLHLDLFSRGEDILMDAGRYSYVFNDFRKAFKSPKAHNTILVDNKEYYHCKDSWECLDLTRGINQKFWSNEKYAYAEGGHLAYQSLENGSVLTNRRIIWLKPDIIVIADELYTGKPHKYNQYFHFNNTGVLTGKNDRYTYHSKKVRAEIKIIAPELSSEIIDTHISRHYNKLEDNKSIVTVFTGKAFTSAYTVIGLMDSNASETLAVEKLAVKSSFKGITFRDEQVEALNIRLGNLCYTVVIAHEEYASPTDTFSADGCVGFGSVVVFNRGEGEKEIGTVLQW